MLTLLKGLLQKLFIVAHENPYREEALQMLMVPKDLLEE